MPTNRGLETELASEVGYVLAGAWPIARQSSSRTPAGRTVIGSSPDFHRRRLPPTPFTATSGHGLHQRVETSMLSRNHIADKVFRPVLLRHQGIAKPCHTAYGYPCTAAANDPTG